MSVPAPREPGQGGRWETIRYALDTNPRTFRLCLILSVAAVAPCLAVVVAELIRHMLLCGTRSEGSQPCTWLAKLHARPLALACLPLSPLRES